MHVIIRVLLCALLLPFLAIHVRFFSRSCAFNARGLLYQESTYGTFSKTDYQKSYVPEKLHTYVIPRKKPTRNAKTWIHVFVHVFAGNSTKTLPRFSRVRDQRDGVGRVSRQSVSGENSVVIF